MVEVLNFTVSLRVTGRRSIVINLISLDKYLELFRSELFSIIHNDLNGFPISSDDDFQDLYSGSSRAFLKGPGKSFTSSVVNSSDDVSIAMVHFKQFLYEVNFLELESLFDIIGVNRYGIGYI